MTSLCFVDFFPHSAFDASSYSKEEDFDVERVDVDSFYGENEPLVGSGRKKPFVWCGCWKNKYCKRIWAILTPDVLKTLLLVAVFITVVVLFTRFGEIETELNVHAVTMDEPWVYNTTTFGLAFLNVVIEAQKVPTEGEFWFRANLVGGLSCPTVMNTSDCLEEVLLTTDHSAKLTRMFSLDQTSLSSLIVSTNYPKPVGFNVEFEELSDFVSYEVIIAGIVLICVYVLIIFEIVHRTIAAMFGAFVALAVLSSIRSRPTFEEVMTWIDWETCGKMEKTNFLNFILFFKDFCLE